MKMHIKSECIACMVERAKYECDMVFEKEEEKRSAISEFIAFLAANLTKKPIQTPTPAFFGTEREEIIKKMSGIADFHNKEKKRSSEVAKSLIPTAKNFYSEATNKIEALIRIAAAGNSMEYGVKGYSYDDNRFKKNFLRILNENLSYNLPSMMEAIKKHKEVLYITDNAGEVVFDAFVIKELEKMGKSVIVAPKKEPITNDATVEDVKEAFAELSLNTSRMKIIPTGSAIGILLERAEEQFLKVLRDNKYLVIAKGMGNYEAMSEFERAFRLKKRLIYVFRAKCEPVAKEVEVKRGEIVAKLA